MGWVLSSTSSFADERLLSNINGPPKVTIPRTGRPLSGEGLFDNLLVASEGTHPTTKFGSDMLAQAV